MKRTVSTGNGAKVGKRARPNLASSRLPPLDCRVEVVPMARDILACPSLAERVRIRQLSMDDFVCEFASGTCWKNSAVGMLTRDHSLSDRVHFEFGAGFRLVPLSRVQVGYARSEPDCGPLTESGWYAMRYQSWSCFPGDECRTLYATVANDDDSKTEGVALFVTKTSASWVPAGHAIVAFVTTVDPASHNYRPAENPC